ncbi:uncharacterized protein LOC101208104 [Cucumis sativus]|uniref:Tyrosine-specific transport protein n=1 Tax=Cucumis sativus TaxID=3659 RepID=A0A0A0KHF6_CUCSA|nr:uncharacterized protein LOC101208104 [Cucumis sativus]XP_031743425.1 uncharacterized protein LOC101208104 [Cucumis sativus]XP_031743426.1 uncharacterized protein LOC101208104 [Cucumis sativus]XP_031743427.1 uncharacterized protein LOC101208104 [Cucumis sativus]XP_031743428.1 uncharacterized protein LOC101208104 [Cucumis sativus]XP_031743429.1 uncharacterized protein LOC101208104 [Cucumis sativus]KGN47817.1 hypothetical protein Csa_003540 [Cucumis sativus]
MNLHSTFISSTLLCPKIQIQCLQLLPRSPLPSPCLRTNLQNFQRSKRSNRYHRRLLCFEQKEEGLQSTEELQPVSSSEKKGTVAGAMAFIIGTSIGSGILAIPEKASPAGFFPSSISIIICWGFLLVEALVLVEISVVLWRRKKKEKKAEEGETGMEVISVRTMAQETLGDFGGTLATVTYVFLGYTSMVAYISKSGEILLQSFNLPSPLSGFLFTLFFSLLISVGRTRAVDQVNQWLTACMIGLLLGIEVLAVQFGGWSIIDGGGDWRKVPTTIPVIIFALVYHDVIPVLCAYLEGDLPRLRVSVLLGSIIPLLALLVWDAIALGLLGQADQVIDPVELLLSVKWSGISYMVEWFSLLAVGTSMLGTLLSFSSFFKEQLSNIFSDLSTREALKEPPKFCLMKHWWEMHKLGLTALAIAVGPSLLVSTTNPDSFSAATDIAGGYCMTMLYGVLPPAMAWAMHSRESEETESKVLSRERSALLGLGLFACGIVVEQVIQDILKLQW